MNIKKLALLIVVGMVMATMLVGAIMPGVALATGETPAPTPTPAVESGGTSPSASSSSGSTSTSSGTSGATSTGAEVILFGVAGAALIAGGFFLTRKARI